MTVKNKKKGKLENSCGLRVRGEEVFQKLTADSKNLLTLYVNTSFYSLKLFYLVRSVRLVGVILNFIKSKILIKI